MEVHRRGAARSEVARLAILDATAHLFGIKGYDHLTIEGIAAEAGVGKQTIYRWWPSKGAIVAECLLEGRLLPEAFVPLDTGDVRTDLTAWLERLLTFAATPGNGELMTSLVAAAAENADIGTHLDETLGAATALTERLQAAIAASQLPTGLDVEAVSDILVGAVVLQILRRAPAPPGHAGRLVDRVLHQNDALRCSPSRSTSR